MDSHFRSLIFLRPDTFTLTELPTKLQVLNCFREWQGAENQATRYGASAWLSLFLESLPTPPAPKPRTQKGRLPGYITIPGGQTLEF